ncbi:MAG: ribonuclease HII [Candidatus Bathyarchaeota archaeon]|nr:ribonuclease HII [Candidatus Bathyarchaeota archaeon]
MLVAGVDDAGRGPIIGPLVIAGVLFDDGDVPKLVDFGVKDSKRLSPRRREELAAQIKESALKYHIEMLSPAEIDKVVETGKKLYRLNRLEARTMAKVITILKPAVAYVDASDVLPERFGQHITEDLAFRIQIVSEHKADVKYPVVSAAAIIAKVERDKALSALQKKYGNLGCGYATDTRTIRFLEDWIRKFGSYPDFVRKSWKPAKRLKREAEAEQTKLI